MPADDRGDGSMSFSVVRALVMGMRGVARTETVGRCRGSTGCEWRSKE
jgi:hypothetical protein